MSHVRGMNALTTHKCIQVVSTFAKVDSIAAHISARCGEGRNLAIRMSMRRFARRTDAFSKQLENLACAPALHCPNYNFARPHNWLKGRSPAIATGAAYRPWTAGKNIGLLEPLGLGKACG